MTALAGCLIEAVERATLLVEMEGFSFFFYRLLKELGRGQSMNEHDMKSMLVQLLVPCYLVTR